MQRIIYLATKNENKVQVAQNSLKKYDIVVKQAVLDTPEIQSSDIEDIVKYSVLYAAGKLGKPVIKGDVGFHIKALNGFPGPFIKFINKWLTKKQFIRLFEKETDKKAYFIDALGYCRPGDKPVCFITNTYGKPTTTPEGDNGNMIDSFFLPDGFNKTIAALSKEDYLKLWDNDRYIQLYKHLEHDS